MRPVLLLLATGCTTQSGFSRQFVETYCEAYDACDTSGRPCPVDDPGGYKVCDFDAKLARTCLEGAFTCDATVRDFEVILTDDACLSVCGVQ